MPTMPAHDGRNIIAPHVVILGAGASRAALPKGDALGKVLPLMSDFVETVGLGPLLIEHGIERERADFESLYDDLVSSGKTPELITRLEERVFNYFHDIQVPDRATLYDFLILALRKKDLIATFNWDPLLMQAYSRNAHITQPPEVALLHGNVACGVCHAHRSVGFFDQTCPKCGSPFDRCHLLYPVKHKDYEQDPFIAGEWIRFRHFLKYAYIVTIFGYSAPRTDAAARSLMFEAWRDNPSQELGQVEIVDVGHKRQLNRSWSEFFVRHHYGMTKTINRSFLGCFPRRSCESLYERTLMCNASRDPMIFPRVRKLDSLQDWFRPLIEEERRAEECSASLLLPHAHVT
jgi:hypothetical protein